MKVTLQELNERVWYRLIKVIYALLYLGFFMSCVFFVKENSREQIPLHLPKTMIEAFQDENFYLLSPNEMIVTMRLIDDDFKGLSDREQLKAIDEIKQIEIKHKQGKKDYVYQSRVVLNVKKAILAIALYFFLIVAFMETIRRSFYYVVAGQIFPKKLQIDNLNKQTDFCDTEE